MRIREGHFILSSCLVSLNLNLGNSPTNQIFVKCDNEMANELIDVFGLEKWIEEEDGITVRIVTSFATKKEDVDELLDYIKKLMK